MPRALVLAAALALPLPSMAQTAATDAVQALTDPGAIADSAAKAVETLKGAGKSRMLARQMLGSEVTGPGGKVLGVVDNLVIVPGGQVLAIVVKPKDGKPVALPYQALKLSAAASAADSLGLSLPMTLEKARGMSALQDLTAAALGQGG